MYGTNVLIPQNLLQKETQDQDQYIYVCIYGAMVVKPIIPNIDGDSRSKLDTYVVVALRFITLVIDGYLRSIVGTHGTTVV